MIKKIKKVSWQSYTQFISLLLINSYYFPFFRSICVPVFNCHGCPAAIFGCPMGVIRNFMILGIIPFSVIGILGVTGILIGRMTCGLICPFGYIQELLYKIPIPKVKIPNQLTFMKYIVLLLFVIVFPYLLGDHILTICKICPVGTLEASIPWRIMLSSWAFDARLIIRMSILFLTLILAIVSFRGFCRFLCPLGAVLALFNPVSMTKLKVENGCKNCGACDKLCPVGIKVCKEPDSMECIRCLKCTKCKYIKLGI